MALTLMITDQGRRFLFVVRCIYNVREKVVSVFEEPKKLSGTITARSELRSLST